MNDTRIQKPTGAARIQQQQDAPLPDVLTVPSLLLSQAGRATRKEGDSNKPLVPGFPGQLSELVVRQSRGGVESELRFPIDDKGRLDPFGKGSPLGHGPFELVLVAKDGTRFSAAVDISPKKTGVSHQGYDELKDLRLVREQPPAPPPRSFVVVPSFLLSQAGQPARKEGESNKPLVPGMEGHFDEMIVSQTRNGLTSERRFAIDDKGRVDGFGKGGPLGHGPFTITLVAKDGERYAAPVDVSPRKTGVTHQGYDEVKDLRLQRVVAEAAAPDAPMTGVAAAFAKTGGAKHAEPTLLGTSPLATWLQRGRS